jgi:heat shock protein HspQ
MEPRIAKFRLGQVVKHRIFAFRGVIYDVDPEFNNTEEWWLAIPEEMRPRKDQPFYHLLAENEQSCYTAYVSEQNLLPDESGEPVGHPDASALFTSFAHGEYRLRPRLAN